MKQSKLPLLYLAASVSLAAGLSVLGFLGAKSAWSMVAVILLGTSLIALNAWQYWKTKGIDTVAQERICQAMDSAETNVMIADADLNICYINDSLLDMLTSNEHLLQQELAAFNVNTLIGTNIDTFHKNPAHQRNLLSNLRATTSSEIKVAGRVFGLIVTPLFDKKGNRQGTSVEWKDRTEELAQEKRMQQIGAALEGANTNVMIADEDFNIMYWNESLDATLRGAESALREQLSNFSVNKLMGTNIDTFHKNPAHQRNILSNLTTTYQSEISVAGLTFSLTVNPIFDNDQNRIGTVVEWENRTAEVEIENEIESILVAANDGQLDSRIELSNKEGFMKTIGLQMNSFLDTNQKFVEDVSAVMVKLADGDLRDKITASYQGKFGELTNSINSTIEKLSSVVSKIRDNSRSVEQGVVEISQGNLDLQNRTETQASTLEETAASMEEIASSVKDNNANAQRALVQSGDAESKAKQGGDVVHNVIQAMEAIDESSKRIDDIIGVIDEIAFQTNLLALNAAVEAARAGEQGRGFAVVASEVRNLAQRSAASAKEIKDLIKDSSSKVKDGTRLAQRSGEALSEIVSAVLEVGESVKSISTSSEEQTIGIEQINTAVSNMDSMTQQNSALVEEITSSSQEMTQQARDLMVQVSQFTIDNDAGFNTAPAAVAASNQKSSVTPKPAFKSIPVAAPKSAASGDNSDSSWESF